jgi:hypothetical protein
MSTVFSMVYEFVLLTLKLSMLYPKLNYPYASYGYQVNGIQVYKCHAQPSIPYTKRPKSDKTTVLSKIVEVSQAKWFCLSSYLRCKINRV